MDIKKSWIPVTAYTGGFIISAGIAYIAKQGIDQVLKDTVHKENKMIGKVAGWVVLIGGTLVAGSLLKAQLEKQYPAKV